MFFFGASRSDQLYDELEKLQQRFFIKKFFALPFVTHNFMLHKELETDGLVDTKNFTLNIF